MLIILVFCIAAAAVIAMCCLLWRTHLDKYDEDFELVGRPEPQKPIDYFFRWLPRADITLLESSGIPLQHSNLSQFCSRGSSVETIVAVEAVEMADTAAASETALAGKQAPATASATDPDEDGVLINSAYLDSALRVLGYSKAALVNTGLTNGGTPIKELVYCHLGVAPDTQPVSVARNVKLQKPLTTITAALLTPQVLMPVEIGYDRPSEQDWNVFRVIINNSPVRRALIQAPESIWGMTLGPNARAAHQPSGLGTAITGPGGYVIAELVGLTLYIHHDLCAMADPECAVGLYTRILLKLQNELKPAKLLKSLVQDYLPAAAASAEKGARNQWRTSVIGLTTKTEPRQFKTMRMLCDWLLVPALAGPVEIMCANTNRPPADQNTAPPALTIKLNTSLLGTRETTAPKRLFGLDFKQSTKGHNISGQGIPISDADGTLVGELLGNELYVHFYMLEKGSLPEALIFARLLVEVREMMATLCAPEEERKALQCAQYARACLAQVSLPLWPEDRKSRPNLAQTQTQYHDLMLLSRRLEQDVYQLEAAPHDALGEEFDRLFDIAQVLDVKATRAGLIVETGILNCADPRSGILHEIGAFDIHIPNKSDVEIKWINKTHRIHGFEEDMHAPHVFANGHACLGSVKDLFPELIKKRDFVSAVQLAIVFIESVNVDDSAGKKIHRWPRAHR
jgi:hypothetical protein